MEVDSFEKLDSKNKLGFGTWGIGGDTGPLSGYGPTDDKKSIEVLRYAYANGINFYDTAPPYGNGNSEILLKEAFYLEKNKPNILTKVGVNFWGEDPNYCPEFIDSSLKLSFDRLGIKKIHCVIFHSLKSFSAEIIKEGFFYLKKLKYENKIEKIGLSLKSPLDLLSCENFIEEIDLVEVNLNLLDLRLLDIKVQKLIMKHKIEVVTRTPFSFGFLTDSIDENYIFLDSDHRKRWSKEQIKTWVKGRKSLEQIFLRYGYSEAIQILALKFCMSFDFVNYVIPGMLSIDEVKQNLKVFEVNEFSKDLMKELVEHGNNFSLV
jgi:aryl-alcohol dehydrogenase-like predicted oxidoreductase